MADISKKELQKEIEKILKNAKLANTSTKKVIQKLEADLGVDLSDKKKLIDELVMDYVNNLDSEEEQEDDDEEEHDEKDDKNDSDWGKSSPKKRKVEEKKKPAIKAKKKKTGGGGGAKGSGYTRAYKLSPALAELMGAQEMPRHEVVKRVWEIIKVRNLYDPSNRRFVICDKDLLKVMGTSRFRAFGMMKYLKTHFLD
ncbi:upstream activation factor subunit spp27 [Manduca sexta]|uniref:upstream activation factor subunit spp27 n=1 Tax=Manduca sexta TaxID=7130 RepID=UPI0011829623|nr:upstream activation factor subunit spp27 [Manduca sexta]